MKKEIRTTCFDNNLQVEAYCLEGIVQSFPNHLHEYYVIGCMVSGQRYLSCKNKEYNLREGDMVLFNPSDNHNCAQVGTEPLHYLGMNIAKTVMQGLVSEIAKQEKLPYFSPTVIADKEVREYFRILHENLMKGSGEFENDELLFFMISKLLKRYNEPFFEKESDCDKEIELICRFFEEHFIENISLEELCSLSGISKSSLLRSFTKVKGMTPYRYLQSIRINAARGLLEQGETLTDTALKTGFTDQSHFSKFFNMFIGLTPGTYRDIFQRKMEERGLDENKI
jgi:AraC-like DNA-binding protein/mannose-6-phosphate isomerase-like protein (cupin superfamily)